MKATDQDEKAVAYFKKAILSARETSNMGTLLPSLVNISALSMKQKEFDSAIRHANECYKICMNQGLDFGKGKAPASLTKAHIQKWGI